MTKVSNVTLGMAFKTAVQSANAQGLYDPTSIKAKTIELLEVLIQLAPEYGVDLSESSSYGGGKSEKKEREIPEGASVFVSEGETWIDFRGAKDKGTVNAKHPDFKTFDYKTSVWMFDPEGNPNDNAAPLVIAAEAALV